MHITSKAARCPFCNQTLTPNMYLAASKLWLASVTIVSTLLESHINTILHDIIIKQLQSNINTVDVAARLFCHRLIHLTSKKRVSQMDLKVYYTQHSRHYEVYVLIHSPCPTKPHAGGVKADPAGCCTQVGLCKPIVYHTSNLLKGLLVKLHNLWPKWEKISSLYWSVNRFVFWQEGRYYLFLLRTLNNKHP